MKKIIIELVFLTALFFATWFAIYQINWMEVFQVEKVAKTTEEKLGELFWKLFSGSKKDVTDKSIIDPVDSVLIKLCKANGINRSTIKLHVLADDEINAFALPDRHLVVFTGLITASETPEELAGVLGHEVAHIQLNHVMKKLVKEIGLSTLIAIATGNGGGEAVGEVARLLSSSAYDRKFEKEADMKSVDYMINSNINPEPFAEFLFRLAQENALPSQLEWISTHPDSEARSKYILEYVSGKSIKSDVVLPVSSWDNLKQRVEDLSL